MDIIERILVQIVLLGIVLCYVSHHIIIRGLILVIKVAMVLYIQDN